VLHRGISTQSKLEPRIEKIALNTPDHIPDLVTTHHTCIFRMHSVTTRFFVPRDTDFVSDHLVAFYKNNAPPKKPIHGCGSVRLRSYRTQWETTWKRPRWLELASIWRDAAVFRLRSVDQLSMYK